MFMRDTYVHDVVAFLQSLWDQPIRSTRVASPLAPLSLFLKVTLASLPLYGTNRHFYVIKKTFSYRIYIRLSPTKLTEYLARADKIHRLSSLILFVSLSKNNNLLIPSSEEMRISVRSWCAPCVPASASGWAVAEKKVCDAVFLRSYSLRPKNKSL